MSQHDYVLDNNMGAAVRADINSALSAIVTQNSGSFEPDTTYPLQIWADTTNTSKILIKQRSMANNSWATLYHLQGNMSYPLVYRIKNYTGNTEVAEYDLFGNYTLGLSPRSGALTSKIENTDPNTGAKVTQVLSTNAGTITLNKDCLIDGGGATLLSTGGAFKIGTASAHPLALSVGGADVATYSEAAATLGNMTASVSRDSNLVYQLSNTNAGASTGANLQLTSNAGSLTFGKFSLASGLGGGGNISNSGGGLFLGTSDTGTLSFVTNNTAAANVDSNGNVLAVKATGGLGYGTGAGSTVTQTTSRTNPTPAINFPNGDITLFTAAGSATPASFSVPNSLVGAKDVPTIAVRGATNKYITQVTNVVAGTSFEVTFWTTGGTAVDTPIFHFNLGKGS